MKKNIRETLQRYLALSGIAAVSARNGISAQRLLLEEPFSAGIVDLRMPGMDGLELLRWIREEGPKIPVIMISAYGEIHDAVQAMKIGVEDYIVKSFDPEEVVLRLQKIIDDQNLRNQVEAGR